MVVAVVIERSLWSQTQNRDVFMFKLFSIGARFRSILRDVLVERVLSAARLCDGLKSFCFVVATAGTDIVSHLESLQQSIREQDNRETYHALEIRTSE